VNNQVAVAEMTATVYLSCGQNRKSIGLSTANKKWRTSIGIYAWNNSNAAVKVGKAFHAMTV